MGDSNVAEEDMAADAKLEPPRDATPSSVESDLDDDVGAEPTQEPAQPQKRKGGRKPIYATSEERKQRNRQAQAAFRERRTEYIKQLEATIKQHEEALSSLQQSHRSAADECLMLRYKNSLLERILLEKGIDVQAELQMKTGSPTLGFPHHTANIPQVPASQPPLQRAAIHRHHARRSGHNFLPKLAPGQPAPEIAFQSSPQGHPTPSSHASSPISISTKSPMVMQQGGNTPPTSAVLAQPQAQQYHHLSRTSQQPPNAALFAPQQISPNVQRPVQRPAPLAHYQSSASVVSSHSTSSRHSMNAPMSNSTGSYQSPFQKHYDQLEQEYDAQQTQSMLDEPELDDASNTSPDHLQGSFPAHFNQQHPQQMPAASEFYQPAMSAPSLGQQQTSHPSAADGQFGDMGDIDPNDPMLDADPFGLSASMHYPTAYSFEPPPQR